MQFKRHQWPHVHEMSNNAFKRGEELREMYVVISSKQGKGRDSGCINEERFSHEIS